MNLTRTKELRAFSTSLECRVCRNPIEVNEVYFLNDGEVYCCVVCINEQANSDFYDKDDQVGDAKADRERDDR